MSTHNSNEDDPHETVQDQDSQMPQEKPTNKKGESSPHSAHKRGRETSAVLDDKEPQDQQDMEQQVDDDDDDDDDDEETNDVLEGKIMDNSTAIEKCYDNNGARDVNILKTMIEHQSNNTNFPMNEKCYDNNTELCEFIKLDKGNNGGQVQISVEEFEIKVRLRALEAKFRLIVMHKGLSHEFDNPMYKQLFELSKELWGPKYKELSELSKKIWGPE